MVKIVFLDRATFPRDLTMNRPNIAHEWVEYDYTDASDVLERSRDCEVIVTNKVPIRREQIKQLPKLKMISVTATGLNNIDMDACQDHGIHVTNVTNYGTDSVAEHTLMLIFNLFKQFPSYHHAILNDAWSLNKNFCYIGEPIRELSQSTIGIIGPGVLGQRVGSLAKSLGMKVVYVGNQETVNSPKYAHLKLSPLSEALPSCDVISIHCPLTPKTKNLITIKELREMRSTAFLINTSRGGIVNEKDLATALQEGVIAGAGFDVLTEEPPSESHLLYRLRAMPNFILTPHMAWLGKRSIHNLMQMALKNIDMFYQNHQSVLSS